MKKESHKRFADKFFSDKTIISLLVLLLVIGTGILLYRQAKAPKPVVLVTHVMPSKPLPKMGHVSVKPIPNYQGGYKVVS